MALTIPVAQAQDKINLSMTKNGQNNTITSCDQYWSLKDNGWDADINPETEFTGYDDFLSTCETRLFLKQSIKAEHTRFPHLIFTTDNLQALPAELGEILSPSNSKICTNRTNFMDCAIHQAQYAAENIRVTEGSLIVIEDEGSTITIHPTAQGDFDHDGWDDILIHVNNHSKNATYVGRAQLCLSWKDNDPMMTLTDCVQSGY